MEPDRELLRQYANEGHEAAFAEVVRRHADLVYSAALRLVAGDAHLAQDVAQNVFTALARKAGTLSRRENLLGWLHTTTRYAASVAVRGERRRRTHEQEAGTTMHNDSATTEMDWMQLQPALDEAVGRLHAQDREAVLLRFFQGKSHREVGAELGVNEVLARKRVDRALEKLRVHLTRRGVTLSSALIAGAITTHSVQAAPAGLATSLGSAALAHAAHAGAAASFLKGITMTTKTKNVLAAGATLVIVLITVGLWWWFTRSAPSPEKVARAPKVVLTQTESPKPPPAPAVKPVVISEIAAVPKSVSAANTTKTISANPQSDLKTAFADIARLYRTGDVVAVIETYVDPDYALKSQYILQAQTQRDTQGDVSQDWASQYVNEAYAQAFDDLQGQTPTLNAAGDEATYTLTKHFGDDEMRSEITMIRIDGLWYMKEFY